MAETVNMQKTPHSSPLPASYGVSIACMSEYNKGGWWDYTIYVLFVNYLLGVMSWYRFAIWFFFNMFDTLTRRPTTSESCAILVYHHDIYYLDELYVDMLCIFLSKFCYPLHWRHNEPYGVSNHQRLNCLLNRLFWGTSKKISKLCVFVRGIDRWLADSPHKGPVTPKLFPFDDVIMYFHIT